MKVLVLNAGSSSLKFSLYETAGEQVLGEGAADWSRDPAQLTVRKQLFPAGDPGRFDLVVNGTTVIPGAGDGATETVAVRPGSYDFSEAAVPPANAADYISSVTCRTTPRSRRPAYGVIG